MQKMIRLAACHSCISTKDLDMAFVCLAASKCIYLKINKERKVAQLRPIASSIRALVSKTKFSLLLISFGTFFYSSLKTLLVIVVGREKKKKRLAIGRPAARPRRRTRMHFSFL